MLARRLTRLVEVERVACAVVPAQETIQRPATLLQTFHAWRETYAQMPTQVSWPESVPRPVRTARSSSGQTRKRQGAGSQTGNSPSGPSSVHAFHQQAL